MITAHLTTVGADASETDMESAGASALSRVDSVAGLLRGVGGFGFDPRRLLQGS